MAYPLTEREKELFYPTTGRTFQSLTDEEKKAVYGPFLAGQYQQPTDKPVEATPPATASPGQATPNAANAVAVGNTGNQAMNQPLNLRDYIKSADVGGEYNPLMAYLDEMQAKDEEKLKKKAQRDAIISLSNNLGNMFTNLSDAYWGNKGMIIPKRDMSNPYLKQYYETLEKRDNVDAPYDQFRLKMAGDVAGNQAKQRIDAEKAAMEAAYNDKMLQAKNKADMDKITKEHKNDLEKLRIQNENQANRDKEFWVQQRKLEQLRNYGDIQQTKMQVEGRERREAEKAARLQGTKPITSVYDAGNRKEIPVYKGVFYDVFSRIKQDKQLQDKVFENDEGEPFDLGMLNFYMGDSKSINALGEIFNTYYKRYYDLKYDENGQPYFEPKGAVSQPGSQQQSTKTSTGGLY